MKFIEVSHLEFDLDDKFGDEWTNEKQDYQDNLEEQYLGIYGSFGKNDDVLDDITTKSGFDIKNACIENLSSLHKTL